MNSVALLCLVLAAAGDPRAPDARLPTAAAWGQPVELAGVQLASPDVTNLPEGLTAPVLVDPPFVPYPAELREREDPPAGVVVVRFTIGVDGTPREIVLTSAVDPTLDALAISTVEGLRYRPAVYRGQPAEIGTFLQFDFRPPTTTSAPEPAIKSEDEAETDVDETGPDLADVGPVRIRGTLLEAGRRQPLSGVLVSALPAGDRKPGRQSPREVRLAAEEAGAPAWSSEGVTGPDGSFELRGVPDGRARVIFVAPGFERLEYVVEVGKNEVLEGTYYQTRLETNPYRTVVKSEFERPAEITRRTVTVEEVSRLPGSQGDPLKGIQNFPGLARTPFGAGGLIVRGAAPEDSGVYLGGHELPVLYHFGGITSVFNADLIEDISFYSGNFDSRWGDAIGGIVDVKTRQPRDDGFHGYADADVFDASALLQGPVKDGSFALSARRSYIDLPLGALEVVPFAPRYWDYQGVFEYPVGPGRLGVRALGSDDQFVIFETIGDGFDFQTGFHRADLYYELRKGKWSALITPSFLYSTEDVFTNDTDRYTFSFRAEGRYRHSSRFGIIFGTDTRAGVGDFRLRANPVIVGGPPDPDGEAVQSFTKVPFATPGLYATANIRLGTERPVLLSPGARFTAYAVPNASFSADPRLNVRWDVADRWTLKAGVGKYSQSPDLLELDEVFGNPELRPEQSIQSSAGVAWQLPRDVTAEVTGFYRHLWDVSVPSTDVTTRNGQLVPERYANTGIGRSYGAELLLRRSFTRSLYGWIAYTLSRSELQATRDDPYVLTSFDQTHILILLAGYKLPRNWSVGLRFRLTSGNPVTPVVDGVFDSTTGEYIPLPGPPASDRFPLFHQLDLRVDKTWAFRLVRLMAYLDIQNVYNAKNPEFLVESYDYQESARLNSLPIVPSLGVRLDF